MRYILGILGLGALAGIFYFIYKRFIAPSAEGDTQTCPDGSVIPVSQSCPRTMGGNNNPNGIPQPAPVSANSLGKGSTLITTGASLDNTSFDYKINESNLASYNLFTSAGNNPKLIHYALPFNQTCYSRNWYKGWLYDYRGFSQDTNTGAKTCYYGVDKSKLPAEIFVQTPASGSCANFKLYLSGVEYRFIEIRNINAGNQQVNFCVYQRQ